MRLLSIRSLSLITFFLCTTMHAFAQTSFPLYEGAVPNQKQVPDEETSSINKDGVLILSKVSRPTLTVYQPARQKRNGTAVIICPGGGYWILAAGHEGADVAKRFTEMGITAFVLKYRIPSDQVMMNREIGPLQDAQRAIQVVREQADRWGINPGRVGILGFSAGGHLASTAGTHYQEAVIENPKNTSLRPDFMVLVYPVISFTEAVGHSGSKEQLLGKNAPEEKIRQYSNELQVSPSTPPTFLVHAKDDPVKVENTLLFADALKQNGVAHRVHLYENGGHGYGMINPKSEVRWMDLVEVWISELFGTGKGAKKPSTAK